MKPQPLSELIGAITVILVWALTAAGLEVPAPVSAAITVVVTSAVYRLRRRKTGRKDARS